MSCAVIIPSLGLDEDTKKCIQELLKQKKINIKIYLISNKKIKKKLKKVKIICLGNVNMSTKRNYAVKMANEKYIAFIDSDAFPSKDWLYNGIKLLKKNKNYGIITGPDIPPINQKGMAYYIGLAHKSFLLSGNKNFRKNIKNQMKCSQASSCNMIMKKNTFLKVGGMSEDIYIGEDKDLCDKIIKIKEIIYSPKVLIYHKSRNFIPFLLQRFSYGTSIFDLIKNNKKINFNNLQYFAPLFMTLFYTLAFFIEAPIFLLKLLYS